MKNREGDDNFFNLLLNETYRQPKTLVTIEEHDNTFDFQQYFEHKFQNENQNQNQNQENSLMNFIIKKNIHHCIGEHISSLGVIRIHLKNQILDFPQNWSFFKKFFVGGKATKEKSVIFFDSENRNQDEDHLAEILSSVCLEVITLSLFLVNGSLIFALFDHSHKTQVEEFKELISYLSQAQPTLQASNDM